LAELKKWRKPHSFVCSHCPWRTEGQWEDEGEKLRVIRDFSREMGGGRPSHLGHPLPYREISTLPQIYQINSSRKDIRRQYGEQTKDRMYWYYVTRRGTQLWLSEIVVNIGDPAH
jgi:hypothetical protein